MRRDFHEKGLRDAVASSVRPRRGCELLVAVGLLVTSTSGHTCSGDARKMLYINFRAAGYADRGTLYRTQLLEHTPTCMRPVHFGVSLWTALVRSMSMRPGSNELLRIPPTQLGTEQ